MDSDRQSVRSRLSTISNALKSSHDSRKSHQSRKPYPDKKKMSENLFDASDDESGKLCSKNGSRSRSKGNSNSRARSTSSMSRSMSKPSSRSRSSSNSGSDSRSRSQSRSGSRSGSGSRSRSRSKSGSRSGSRSRSKSGSRSRSRSKSGSRSRSRSKSGSRSRSRNRSDSPSIPHSKSSSGRGIVSSRKRPHDVSDSDSDSEDPISKKTTKKMKKSKLSESGQGSEYSNEHNSCQKKSGGNRVANAHSNKTAKIGSAGEKPKKGNDIPKTLTQLSDSEDEALRQKIRDNQEQEDENVNHFDAMMSRKKAERGYKRKKEGVDVINDNEEKISKLVRSMRDAAEADRKLNMRKQPATKKMSMLQVTMQQISKVEMLEGFLEANLLSVLTDWLAPMPDKQLPTHRLRECVIKWLLNLPPLSEEMLKQSGIGKAIMYLYRHPKEVKLNKENCGRLINKWSRPIFNNSDDFTTLSKEERLERDVQMMGRNSRNKENEAPSDLNENGEPLKPGDKGWCHRARVPMPGGNNYVARPKWKSSVDMTTVKKQGMSKLDKNMRHFENQKRLQKARRAVGMSIEGRAMPL